MNNKAKQVWCNKLLQQEEEEEAAALYGNAA